MDVQAGPFGLQLLYRSAFYTALFEDAMELHKLAFPERPQPMLVDEEVRDRVATKRTSKSIMKRQNQENEENKENEEI